MAAFGIGAAPVPRGGPAGQVRPAATKAAGEPLSASLARAAPTRAARRQRTTDLR